MFGISQGFVFESLFFNAFFFDFFFIKKETDFASCANDNTPYVRAKNLVDVINSLQENSINCFSGFQISNKGKPR